MLWLQLLLFKSDRSSDISMDRTDEIAFRSLMVGDVNCLKGEVRALRTELASSKTCVGWVQLEWYLHCAILRYACGRPSPA